MTGAEFEATYHHKRIRIRGEVLTGIGAMEGTVTAALYQHGDGEDKTCTILAVMRDDYAPGRPEAWVTLCIPDAEFEECMTDVELV